MNERKDQTEDERPPRKRMSQRALRISIHNEKTLRDSAIDTASFAVAADSAFSNTLAVIESQWAAIAARLRDERDVAEKKLQIAREKIDVLVNENKKFRDLNRKLSGR